MEPRPSEKHPESLGEDQATSARPPERKRRFQIIKLEERIAPSNGNGPSNHGKCVTGTYNCR
jgi:hypothetical protein